MMTKPIVLMVLAFVCAGAGGQANASPVQLFTIDHYYWSPITGTLNNNVTAVYGGGPFLSHLSDGSTITQLGNTYCLDISTEINAGPQYNARLSTTGQVYGLVAPATEKNAGAIGYLLANAPQGTFAQQEAIQAMIWTLISPNSASPIHPQDFQFILDPLKNSQDMINAYESDWNKLLTAAGLAPAVNLADYNFTTQDFSKLNGYIGDAMFVTPYSVSNGVTTYYQAQVVGNPEPQTGHDSVPEPSTLALAVCGAIGLFLRRRRSAVAA